MLCLQNEPYMMKVEDENGITYEGFCVDLIKKIAEDLKFQYKIKEVDDGSYGRKNDLGEWNGMIRELIDGVRRCTLLPHFSLYPSLFTAIFLLN